jgi:ubiquinone/menaquinone biosynthesis C-methylase UbiE
LFLCKFDNARDELVNDYINRNLVGKKIIELGCGSGDRTKLFYDVSTVIGVDIKSGVDLQRKDKFVFSLADATKLPFADESFDAVVSFDVVEHILDDLKFVSEAFRVCKRKGCVLLGTPNRLRLSNRLMNLIGKKIVYPYYLGPDTIHVREYTQAEFASLCENTGLVGECVSLWLGLVGKINVGVAVFPDSLSSLTQYLLFIGNRP